MLRHSLRRAERRLGIVVAAGCLLAGAAPGAQGRPEPPPATVNVGTLQTFELAKPPVQRMPAAVSGQSTVPPRPPAARGSLRTMIGVGYVQGADWGAELLAGGSFAGAQVQLNTLVTSGSEGLMFDHGSISIFQPDSRWHLEAGDVFSQLRGLSFGGRVSWTSGGRRPSIGVYAGRRGLPERRTVLSYRDQLMIGGQTLLDAEVATDRSHLLRSRLSGRRFEIEAFYRSQREPHAVRDASLSGGVRLWRGLAINAGIFGSALAGERSEWRTVSLRLPLSRFVDLTLERAFTGGGGTSQSTSAAMATFAAGDLRFFHRYQQGTYDFVRSGVAGSIERRQTQSMTSYSPGPRLDLALQLATQRSETGQTRHWEELQATVKLTRTTTVRTVTAVPNLRDPERFQAYVRQDLPARFALQADYGRLSAYQPVLRGLDRSRVKVMLFKTVDIATPARGALVAGRVVDDAGRGVRGARVKLGPYSADADASGAFAFRHVPRGEYDLSLDAAFLPADFAWDGKGERIVVAASPTHADLRVTPLNAIHGRVYADLDGNGRFDRGEGVAGAVVRVGDHVTMTDDSGAWAVYNLWPGRYVVRVDRLPGAYRLEQVERPVTLLDGGPVTGADFVVTPHRKAVIWEGLAR